MKEMPNTRSHYSLKNVEQVIIWNAFHFALFFFLLWEKHAKEWKGVVKEMGKIAKEFIDIKRKLFMSRFEVTKCLEKGQIQLKGSRQKVAH